MPGLFLVALALFIAGLVAPPRVAHADDAGQACPVIRFAPCVSADRESEAEASSACDGRCQRLVEQIRRGCGATSGAPYADTAYLRLGVSPELPSGARERLALVALARNPSTASELAGPLLEGGLVQQHLAATHIALAALRSPDWSAPEQEVLREAIARMEATEETAPVPPSDRHFFEAILAERDGRPIEARGLALEALASEPGFFGAAAFALRLEVTEMDQMAGRSPRACRRAADELLEVLGLVANIDPCRRFAAHLEVFVSRRLAAPAASSGLAISQVYLSLLARREDLAYTALERLGSVSPLFCRSVIERDLLALIEAYGAALGAEER